MTLAEYAPTDRDPRLTLGELAIERLERVDAEVVIPGSKSYTNRAVLIAALADGATHLDHALMSEDTHLIVRAVQQYGRVRARVDPDAEQMEFTVGIDGEQMLAPTDEVLMGNAGTPIRFVTSLASLAEGTSFITGNARMQQRPIHDLVEGLRQLGVPARTVNGTGCPPVEVVGPSLRGGHARIRGSVSSQYTSSLLLSAPYAERDVELTLTDELTSKPYVDMTIRIMQQFGVVVERDGYRAFHVRAGQRYRGQRYMIEPDASNMSYFLAAAAITGGYVRIPGIGRDSVQGDVQFTHVLEGMGCTVHVDTEHVELRGGCLRGIDVDMNWMPDLVPTLAVVAAFAEGPTRITNIGNLRIKECDRIAAMETELRKTGIRAESTADTLTVYGGRPEPTAIDTYDDHRIAMSFAIAGLRAAGMVIRNPGCVSKSFPTFWRVLDDLRSQA